MMKSLQDKPIPTTLAGLLSRIRFDLFNGTQTSKAAVLRMQNLSACVTQLAHLLKKAPNDVNIDSILTIEARLVQKLRKRGFAPVTIRNYVGRLRALIRYAKRFGCKHPRFALTDKWDIIPVKLRKHGTPFIIRHAIENNIAPATFTRSDLENWCRANVLDGKTLEEVEHQRKHFSYTIKNLKLSKHFRKFETEKTRLPHFRLRVDRMPARLRVDVIRIIRWADMEQKAGRLRWRNTQLLQQNLEMLCGYAINVKGLRTVTRIDQLLTKQFLYAYTSWLSDKRGCSRTAVINALGAIHQIVLRHPRFDNHNFSWWKELLQELEPQAQSDVDERRRYRQIGFESLAAIPEKIRTERLQSSGLSLKEVALMIRDELVMRFLVKAVMAPSCVRQATLSNIQKAPVPLDDPSFVVADWAKPLLVANPELPLWQFSFSATETPGGKSVRGLILHEIADPLESYVKKWRPILLGESKSDSLFIRESGREPLTRADLTSLVRSLTRRHAGIGVTPASIKPSFVDFWLDLYPNGEGWVDLANILWMEYTSVRQAFDPAYRSSFSGKTTQ